MKEVRIDEVAVDDVEERRGERRRGRRIILWRGISGVVRIRREPGHW